MFKGEFENKTLITTGAASGISLLLTEEFLKYGGNVVMADVNEQALKEQEQRLKDVYGDKVVGVKCDVRSYSEITNVCETAVKKFGGIDILVNLAGGAETRILNHLDKEFCDVPIEVYEWGLDVNLKAQLFFDHAVLKQMRRQKSGVLINIGSITGVEGCDTNVAYSTAKSGAINGLTKSIAQYGSKYGVRCMAISPGPVLTRKNMSAMKTLVGRAAEPIEIVNLILYVSSSHGAFMTGENILIDGGRNIMRDKVHGDYGKYGE